MVSLKVPELVFDEIGKKKQLDKTVTLDTGIFKCWNRCIEELNFYKSFLILAKTFEFRFYLI